MKAGLLLALIAFVLQATPSKPEHAGPVRFHVSLKAEHYQAVKDLVRPGDLVYAFCVRAPATTAGDVPWRAPLGARRIAALAGATGSDVQQAIVLSSTADLKALLAEWPKGARWAIYNSEPGMTPSSELADIDGSVREFARLAHGQGLKVAWGPTNRMIEGDEDRYLGLARYVDCMGLQHQKVLQLEGLAAFVALTKDRATRIRRVNPACSVEVQVVLGRSSSEQCAQALEAVAPFVQSASIWTMRDTDGLRRVLVALKR